MLIQFTIENFLSFKEKVAFSMIKGRQRKFPSHLIETDLPNNLKILKTALIYGANASGKSNFVKALNFFQDLIIFGNRPKDNISRKPFALDRNWKKKPTEFTVEFSYKGKYYSYGISFDTKMIHQEWLYEILKTTEKMLFERFVAEDKQQIRFGSWVNSLNKEEIQFLNFVAKGTRENQPFVTECVERNVDYFVDLNNWARNSLTIITPTTKAQLGPILFDEDKSAIVNEIIRYLSDFGTGIVNFDLKPISLDEFPEDFRAHLEKTLDSDSLAGLERISDKRKIFIRKDESRNELIGEQLFLLHRSSDPEGELIPIDPEDESDGTIRLIDLIPILLSKDDEETVYVIDEFDRSIHPKLSYQLIKLFLETATDNFQLIVTTHEENLLDLDLLRRDEIWFIEKDYYGSSHMYSLEDYQPRYDKDIRKGYLQGRFGSIPILREINLCE